MFDARLWKGVASSWLTEPPFARPSLPTPFHRFVPLALALAISCGPPAALLGAAPDPPTPRAVAATAAAPTIPAESAAPPVIPASRDIPRGRAVIPWTSTKASWYGYAPTNCYDARGKHPFPEGIQIWTAHKTLPCGTVLEVTTSTGSALIPVWDRGPYVKGRDLDLSRDAFVALGAALSQGVIRVTYRVKGANP